jgi:hypothetical protein
MTLEQQIEALIVLVFFLALPSFLFFLYVALEMLENHHNTKPQNKNTKENPK